MRKTMTLKLKQLNGIQPQVVIIFQIKTFLNEVEE